MLHTICFLGNCYQDYKCIDFSPKAIPFFLSELGIVLRYFCNKTIQSNNLTIKNYVHAIACNLNAKHSLACVQ